MFRVRLHVALTCSLAAACHTAPDPPPAAAAPAPSAQIHSAAPVSCGDRGVCAGSGKPLYIIDGVMLDSTQYPVADATTAASRGFAPLSPSEIDSIAIARGDTAVDKYGPRARNGVILIWTKRAAKQAPPQ